jgi:hypothetical protein
MQALRNFEDVAGIETENGFRDGRKLSDDSGYGRHF